VGTVHPILYRASTPHMKLCYSNSICPSQLGLAVVSKWLNIQDNTVYRPNSTDNTDK